jgi:hypothetical protein
MTRTADFLYSSGFLRTLAIALPSALLAGIGSAMAQTSAPTVSVFAPRVISEPFIDTAPTFTPDGKTVYFQHSDGVRAAIEVSHLVDGAWASPESVSFSDRWNDLEPTLSLDGNYMIFASARAVKEGGGALDGEWGGRRWPGKGGNLWRVDRRGDGWGEPYRLPDTVNDCASVFEPSLARNGVLYFMRPDKTNGKFHLFRAVPSGKGYAQPQPLPFTDIAHTDADPAVSADESFLVFGSNRPPSEKLSLYVVFRHGKSWGVPVRLPDSVNDGAPVMDAHLSADERTLYFSRDRMIWSVPFETLLRDARAVDGGQSRAVHSAPFSAEQVAQRH